MAFWQVFHRHDFARTALFHATSEGEYQDIRAFGVSAPIAVIPNGIDVPAELPVRGSASRTVLYLGRLHPIKGIDLLLRAWNRLKRAGHGEWNLRIVGPEGAPGYLRTLETLVKTERIPDVHFSPPAFGVEKWRAYRSAAVFVLPSRSENFGMTVAESLAASTPVIATRETPWPDLPRVGCGWHVPLSEADLVSALGEALTLSDGERTLMGQRGCSWVTSTLAWDQIARQMAAAYRWARAGGDAPPQVRVN